MERKPRSQPATSAAAFLLVAAGQIYFLRKPLAEGFSSLPPVLIAECAACVLTLAAAAYTATPRGWRSRFVCYAAFGLYLAYMALNLFRFSFFQAFYLAGISTEYRSYGAAIEVGKLILLLIGFLAAVPAMPGPAGRQYAEKLEMAFHRQQMEWSKARALEAQAELQRAADRLQKDLQPEEPAEMMKQPEPRQGGASEENDRASTGSSEEETV